AWIDWPGMPLPDGVNPCIKAGSPGQALASALAGMGRTILPLALAETAITQGRLTALAEPEAGTRAYWLLAPPPQWRSKKVRSLVGFLSE
ncbi:MAG: LysR family transcriptional regulator, partial [Sphingomonadales bacterium]|nr:LysR family transcriptional regulator [Sphingomonadales bacterium]